MRIEEYKGFQIQIHHEQDGFYAEIYRKENLLYTIRESIEIPIKPITHRQEI